jgi:phenylalanyl-tRNA synthetase beta chain
MKLPLNWLKEYVEVNIPAEKLAEKLTMTGLEVESIESPVDFSKVVIGEVLEREKHPNADKLNVAKVNVGNEVLQIVCGAPNLNVGQKVAVALVGAKLGDFEIAKRELRGVTSHGMICSEKELSLGEDHNGIMVLEKNAPIGDDFAKYLKTEKVIDIKIFANRPDLMGMTGLAREVAAALNKKLNLTKIAVKESNECTAQDLVDIEIKNQQLCPRYIAKVVRNVKIGPSPTWMQERLVACGVRPINNLVDISNYVMLEYGQPLHFFDYQKVKGNNPKATIVVRTGQKDEKFTTLDGVNRKLNENMLVIADDKKAIGLAGVMGGQNTEVDDTTIDILIEAAVFDKANIRRTSRALGLRSEAVARFEKGIPIGLPEVAIERSAQLLAELAGGRVCAGKVDVSIKIPTEVSINLETEKVNRFLGVKLTKSEITEMLGKLEFLVSGTKDKILVKVPWWRPDIDGEADLYEEIIRIWGYDKLPSTLPETGGRIPRENEELDFDNVVKKLLSDIGFSEIYTYSFVTGKDLAAVGENTAEAPKVENPLVSDQEYLRSSLIGSMLRSLAENQFNKESLRFFEIGKTFRNKKGSLLPEEKRYLCVGIIGGVSYPIQYAEGQNFYEAKGVLERLAKDLIPSELLEVKAIENTIFKTGRAAKVLANKEEIAVIGEIDKQVLSYFDLKKEAAILYMDLEKISKTKAERIFDQFSRFPKVTRDISILIDKKVEVGQIISKLAGISSLIQKTEVIDIYEGRTLEKNQKSVTVRIEFISMEKTLTEEEVDKVFNSCKNEIKKLGGMIRGDRS